MDKRATLQNRGWVLKPSDRRAPCLASRYVVKSILLIAQGSNNCARRTGHLWGVDFRRIFTGTAGVQYKEISTRLRNRHANVSVMDFLSKENKAIVKEGKHRFLERCEGM